MAIVGELVNFLYGVNGTPSTKAGEISFDSGKKAIYVGDGSAANLVTSHVKDAKFESNKLTIEFVDASADIELDFTDVASTTGVMAVFEKLDTSIKSLDTRITNLDTYVDSSIKALDAAYKLADGSIRTDFAAADKAINDKIGGNFDATNTVAKAIEDAKNAAIAAGTVVTEDSDFISVEVSGEIGGTQTYTIKTNDVASANALAEVKTTADAAAKQSDFNAHAIDSSIHITSAERTAWNAAKSAIDAFLDENAVSDTVVNTLKEIQEYITKDGSAAADMLDAIDAAQDTADQAVLDASTAQAAADKAQGEVDALEGVVSTLSGNFDTHSNDATIHITSAERTAWNAAEKNAKDYADGLASNYDKVGDASKAETAAKEYADAITVNGQAQSSQEITLTGVNITVGGTGTHSESNIDAAIEDLYTQVQAASEAGVQSLAVNTDSSAYAEVSKSTGAITLTIKKVALAAATSTNTGVADAWDVKESIRLAKEGVIGAEGDAADASTIAGAKAYADAQIAANALKWSVLP